MDNFELTVRSSGKTDFALAMQIAFNSHKKAVGYRVTDEKGLILYWIKPDKKDFVPFPFEMNHAQAVDFCWGWVEATKPKGNEPDNDGDNDKGFIVYNEAWGHVDGDWQTFVAIGVIWAMYGK
jgi:hypothetical protein